VTQETVCEAVDPSDGAAAPGVESIVRELEAGGTPAEAALLRRSI